MYKNVSNAFWISCIIEYDIDGLVQDYSNSSANALELLLSCTKPSICFGVSEKQRRLPSSHEGSQLSLALAHQYVVIIGVCWWQNKLFVRGDICIGYALMHIDWLHGTVHIGLGGIWFMFLICYHEVVPNGIIDLGLH